MSERLIFRNAVLWDGRLLGLRDVVITGDRIGEVLAPGTTPSLPGDWEIAANGRTLVPGFIDAHCHSHRILGRGISNPMGPGAGFERRLNETRLPFERVLTPADIEAAARAMFSEAARSGTTCVFDHLRCPSDPAGGLSAAAAAARAIGIRLVGSHASSDADGHGQALAAIAANESFAREQRSKSLVRGQIGLEASFMASDATLERAAAAAQVLGCGVHVHLDEDALDRRRSVERFGREPAQRLAAAGLLTPRTLLAHAQPDDRAPAGAVAYHGALEVLTPRSSADPQQRSAQGSPLHRAAGTDGVAADVRQELLLTGNQAASGALNQLTRSLFGEPSLPQGRLAPGAIADLALLDLRPLHHEADAWVTTLEILAAPVAWTLVAGRVVMREHVLLTADQNEISIKAREAAARVQRALNA